MRRRHFLFWLVGSSLGSLWQGSCTPLTNSGDSTPPNNLPRVASTSTIIADWVVQVGGAAIDHTSILKPGVDPHVYEPVPADTRILEVANLIFYNGYNLEPGLIRLMRAVGSRARQVALAEVVPPLQMTREGAATVPDPHVWGDARNAILMVNQLQDEFSQILPADRQGFRQRADRFTRELNKLDQWIRQQIQTIPTHQRRLVTTHDAFQYYARAYGLEVLGTLIGISTEEQPSAQTVGRLAEAIKMSGVPTIFAETTINPALIQAVAQEAGVRVAPQPLYADSLGATGSGAETYVTMLTTNTRIIVEALGGKYTPFEP